MSEINILIIESNPVIKYGFNHFFETQQNINLIGIFSTQEDAKKVFMDSSIDVVLLTSPDTESLNFIRFIRNEFNTIKIIAFSDSKGVIYIQRFLKSGGNGVLLKTSSLDTIVETIEKVYKGKTIICEEIQQLMQQQKKMLNISLTIRELEMIRLITEGYTNREIANILCLGVETINSYRKDILLKLDVKNTASLVRFALTEKLL